MSRLATNLRNQSCTSERCYHVVLPAESSDDEFICDCTRYTRKYADDRSESEESLLGKRTNHESGFDDAPKKHTAEDDLEDQKTPDLDPLWKEIESIMTESQTESTLLQELKNKPSDKLEQLYICFMDETLTREDDLSSDEHLLVRLSSRIWEQVHAEEDMTEMFRNAFMLFTRHIENETIKSNPAVGRDEYGFKKSKESILDAHFTNNYSFEDGDFSQLRHLLNKSGNQVKRRALEKKVFSLVVDKKYSTPDSFTTKLENQNI